MFREGLELFGNISLDSWEVYLRGFRDCVRNVWDLQGRVHSLGNENELLVAKEAFDQLKQQEQSIETGTVEKTDSVVTKAAEPAADGGVRSCSTSSVGESDVSDSSSPKVKKTQLRSSTDEQHTTGSGSKSANQDFMEPAAKSGTKQTDSVQELVIETSGGGMVEDTAS
jgi:hypothetical protein